MRSLTVLLTLTLGICSSSLVVADENLSKRQAGVAERYQRLEELLLRLADVESAENPERSALLRRAARQSRDKFVLEKLRGATESLQNQEFQDAIDSQEVAGKELTSLLKLLLSEDRSKRIRDEKERYAKLIKDLKRNLNNQRSARARTENGADLDDVQEEQKSVTERSEELKARLSKDNETEESRENKEDSSAEGSEGKTKDGTQDDGEQKEDGKKDDGKKDDGEEKEDDRKEGGESSEEAKEDDKAKGEDESSKSDSAEKGDSNEGSKKEGSKQDSDPKKSSQQQGDPQEGQPSDQQSPKGQQPQQSQPSQDQQSQSNQDQSKQSQPQTPEQEVEKRLQQAIEKMQQAEKELEDAKRAEATEKQREAEENLRAAIDRLERILRQLREEEMQRELAKLEARLRKMAAMQTKVLDDTVALAATPRAQRNRQTDVKAGDLAFEEKKITMEADRAMLLLREEGSSVAFPEVVSQIRSDTSRVADLLGQTKIDAVTQGIQQDILAALEEMIAALQKAQRDLEKQRQQQQQGRPRQGGQREQPLVEALAELKLIRTMETRIKSTTDRYSGLLESGESSVDEVRPLLMDLSDRQNRLYRITRDLVLKRNK